MKFELPPLPYSYDALEPWIDARTMEIHHTKHHQTYLTKLNEALEKHAEWQEKSLEELLTSLDRVPEDIRAAVRNHGGGHYNHSLFWKMMAPSGQGGGGEPSGQVADAIAKTFGTFLDFKGEFSKSAAGIFGSGWAWLVRDRAGKLLITTTPNQDNPISKGERVVLGLDLWEHAYYLKYQSRRPEYIENWWNVVNWKQVASHFGLS